MRPEDLTALIRLEVGRALPDETTTRLGTIPATYSSGRPTVQFDGESVASTKTYPYLSSYTPTAGHRVLLVRSGSTWVVVGRVV